MNGRYHMSYDFQRHEDGITKEELSPRGGCDSIGFISVIHSPDGGSSTAFIGRNGVTGEDWTDGDWFRAWTLLARRLTDSDELGEGQRAVCGAAFDTVRRAILAGRKAD